MIYEKRHVHCDIASAKRRKNSFFIFLFFCKRDYTDYSCAIVSSETSLSPSQKDVSVMLVHNAGVLFVKR